MGLRENRNYDLNKIIQGSYRVAANLPRPQVTPQIQPQNTPMVANSTPSSLLSLGKISTSYGGSTAYEPQGTHQGIDLAMPNKTSIPSPISGTVVDEKTGQGWTPNTPSYGNYITIRDKNGNLARFSHLSNTFVPIGSTVRQGQIIAESGGTGSTYSVSNPGTPGYHLDLRIWQTYQDMSGQTKNKYLNPIDYLNQNS